MKSRFSSFAVLSSFVCLCIIGASMIPLLSIQLNPSKALPSLSVNFSWHDVSSKVIEQEVTAKLEGVFNTVKGIKEINSVTEKGSGIITISFKKNTNLDAVRFEIANLIRQIYSELPEGVSYPELSVSGANENIVPTLTYSINAKEDSYFIKKYAENHILPKLTTIKGVNKIYIYGADPFEWVVNYDTNKLVELSITVSDIEGAIENYFQKQELGIGYLSSKQNQSTLVISVDLLNKFPNHIDWDYIPIKKTGNRIIYLKSLANVAFKQAPAQSYFRINGRNSINMVVYAEKGANTIDVSNKVKDVISSISKETNTGYTLKLINDSSAYIFKELEKIQEKMVFSLLILFSLILLITKSYKYIIVLFLSLTVNILIAVIFYYLFNVELQLYSFAGITISFGFVIDNCIIMIDNLRTRGDKKVFMAILATTLTTAGCLMSTFLLDESKQFNLRDFSLVIAINISVSLLVSLHFVPALMEKLRIHGKEMRFSRRQKRRVLKFTNYYSLSIVILRKPRFKWMLIAFFILGFGLPLHLLPNKIEGEGILINTYNNTFGSQWFCDEIKPNLEQIVGGALRLFTENVYENSHYTDPERTILCITGKMPEGSSIEQLNQVMVLMENYLARFKQVEMFETRIINYKNAVISIYFNKENEHSSFPNELKNKLESRAINLGGLEWSVSGVGKGFSNSLATDFKSNRIELEGYNYDELYFYAKSLQTQLINNSSSRISEVDIISGNNWNNENSNEYYLEFNAEKMALGKVSQTNLYDYLKKRTNSEEGISFINGNEIQKIKLVSDQFQKMSVWDLQNAPIAIGGNQYKLQQMASMEKKKIGNMISKNNQQYHLAVVYNFMGTEPFAKKVRDENIRELRSKLPIGYRVFENSLELWDKKDKTQYYFIFIVILIIFFICSILFESLSQPFAIISMIPISFIGVFLTFYLFDFNFDQGGYASFILLSGISVNAGLYIINDFNNLKKQYPIRNVQLLYYKAFNYKIIPILLTILSTIAGLIPFVLEGQNEAFWFSFAVGSIGGLLFSLVGIFLYLPLLSLKNK